MSGRKNMFVTFGLILSVSLITSAFAVIILSRHYSKAQFDLLNAVLGEVAEQEPETKRIVSAALKEYTGKNEDGTQRPDVLSSLGYQYHDFSVSDQIPVILSAAAGLLAGLSLFSLSGILMA